MRTRFGDALRLSLALALSLIAMNSAPAQRGAATADAAIELELEGSVERTFTSDERLDNSRLVQIVLRSVALKDAGVPVQSMRIPVPGEFLFVVVGDASGTRPSQRAEASDFPRAGDTIRATVREDDRGVWSANGAGWFELIRSGNRQPEREISRDEDSATPGQGPSIDLRGMRCEAKVVRGQLGLEVVQVQNQGPARDAGFQVGDVVVAVRGNRISSTASIRQLALEPKPLELSVIDVNSGRLAEVTLAASRTGPTKLPGSDTPRGEANFDPAGRISSAIGIEVEATRVGLRGAVKVSAVDRAKPGAEAGLEPGDVIVAINQTRVSSVDDFAQALPVQGGKLTLVVRDVRSGKEVPIEVRAAGARPVVRDAERGDNTPSAERSATTDRLGLATELAFYNEEAAVKVIAVKPDSAASRAGMRRGWIILKANDAPMLHPDDLAKAEGDGTGRLTLRVVDPSNDRQYTIDIER